MIRPKPLVNLSKPGWSAAVARLASASTSSNRPVRAELSAAADAAAIRAYQIVEALLAEEKGWAYPRRRD